MATRLLACVLVALLVTASGAGSTSAGEAAALRDRTTTDMPDDFQGSQVHFMYVVPADGTDNQLDTNGTIEQSITRIENWFIGQTGNQGLRVDTYHGVPDITFFRLPQTDAQAMSQYPYVIWTIGADLVPAGFDQPDKVYAVFYDGHDTRSCGAATSPALPKLGVMYLQGWPTGDPAPCHAWGTGTTQPGYFDMGILHEVLHAIGFSPPCAPHKSQDGYGDHVNDSPTDILYAPDATHTSPWDVLHAVLDYNHDDYYRANIPGCADLSNSPYLTPVTVPGVPTAVAATGGNASATVTWTAPASNGGSAITNYVITPYIGATAQAATTVGAVTSTTITGLTNGTTYTFTVAAKSAVGAGAASGASNAVTPVSVPGAPGGVSASAGNASATVTWTAPSANGGSAITGYVVTPYVGSTAQPAFTVGAVTTVTVTGLSNGTTYTFTVAAKNALGTGAASAASNAVTPTAPPPPVKCVVPNVKGKPLATARKKITAGHCKTGKVTTTKSKTVRRGNVISQKPKPGTKLARGSKVELTVSRGGGE
jgi:hypothetical protein